MEFDLFSIPKQLNFIRGDMAMLIHGYRLEHFKEAINHGLDFYSKPFFKIDNPLDGMDENSLEQFIKNSYYYQRQLNSIILEKVIS